MVHIVTAICLVTSTFDLLTLIWAGPLVKRDMANVFDCGFLVS